MCLSRIGIYLREDNLYCTHSFGKEENKNLSSVMLVIYLTVRNVGILV